MAAKLIEAEATWKTLVLKQFPSGGSVGGDPPKPLEQVFKPKDPAWDNGSTFNPGYNWTRRRGPAKTPQEVFNEKMAQLEGRWALMKSRLPRSLADYYEIWRLQTDGGDPAKSVKLRRQMEDLIAVEEALQGADQETADLVRNILLGFAIVEIQEAGGLGSLLKMIWQGTKGLFRTQAAAKTTKTLIELAIKEGKATKQLLWKAVYNKKIMELFVEKGLLQPWQAEYMRAISKGYGMGEELVAMKGSAAAREMMKHFDDWLRLANAGYKVTAETARRLPIEYWLNLPAKMKAAVPRPTLTEARMYMNKIRPKGMSLKEIAEWDAWWLRTNGFLTMLP